MDYRVFPPEDMVDATITLPLSKSIANRALILHALTPGDSPMPPQAECDDSDAIVNALAGPTTGGATVNIGAAGTAMRFLTAYFAATPGCDVILDGSERMRRRPIGALVDALRLCGASIGYAGEEGYPTQNRGSKAAWRRGDSTGKYKFAIHIGADDGSTDHDRRTAHQSRR